MVVFRHFPQFQHITQYGNVTGTLPDIDKIFQAFTGRMEIGIICVIDDRTVRQFQHFSPTALGYEGFYTLYNLQG